MVLKKFPVVPIKFKTVLKLYTILSKGFKVVPNFKNTVKKFKLVKKELDIGPQNFKVSTKRTFLKNFKNGTKNNYENFI